MFLSNLGSTLKHIFKVSPGAPMKYRQLGSTDIQISEIGFGCGNTAGLMIWGTESERVRSAEHAMEQGINYFDTAATYGQGKSEENLGPVLAKLSNRPLVGSKVALQENELEDIPRYIRLSVERSLKRLNLEYLDIVHLHNRVTSLRDPGKTLAIGALLDVNQMLAHDGVQETFEALKNEGKLRYYGFCAFGGDPSAYHEVADKGSFHSLLVFYNILNPSSDREMPNAFSQHNYGQILKKASAKGIGAVALRVLEAGALSGSSVPHELNQGGPSSDPEYATNATRAQALDFLRSSDSESLAQVAIRFALMNQNISTVLVGFSELSQIDEAVACVGKEPFTKDQLDRLEELYGIDFGLI